VPQDCTDKNFFLAPMNQNVGFGASVRGSVLGNLYAAAQTGRIYMPFPPHFVFWGCPNGTWDCYFRPISNCSYPRDDDGAAVYRTGNARDAMAHNQSVKVFHATGQGPCYAGNQDQHTDGYHCWPLGQAWALRPSSSRHSPRDPPPRDTWRVAGDWQTHDAFVDTGRPVLADHPINWDNMEMAAGMLLYVLRPNAPTQARFEAILKDSLPCDFDPEKTISMPVSEDRGYGGI
jgi:hypothetical protein